MQGMSELIFGIKAGYSYFYCSTEEINKVVLDISQSLDKYFEENKADFEGYQTSVWDFDMVTENGESTVSNPDSVLTMLENIGSGRDEIPAGTVVIAKNLNWFLVDEYGNPEKAKISWLLNRTSRFSSPEFRKILIIVSNQTFDKAIPEVIRRDFAKIEFPLPTTGEIEKLYDFIIESVRDNPKFVMPTEPEKNRIIAGARGLTSSEIIKVFSYSIVKNAGIFDPKTVEELRADEINNTPGLKIGKYEKTLDDLKGYDVAKEIVSEWISDENAKGVILLGPAGVGKTHFGQSCGGQYDRLVIEVEFAQLMGDGLVGQAEKAWKKALDVISANANPVAPTIVFVDEIEKGLAGVSGAGKAGANDGGTTDRSASQFLKFLSDARPEGIYVIATCNNIRKLPPEWIRAERWDTAPIFVDLPNRDEQEAILAHYQKNYEINAKPKDMTGWSGAEIKTWCKLAAKKVSLGKNANEADGLVIPVSQTMKDEIDDLRAWSRGKTICASKKTIDKEIKNKRTLTM